MGAGESWGKGRCRSQGAPGPCSDMCGAGEGSGGGSVATRKGSCALTPCSEFTSHDEKPCKGWPVSEPLLAAEPPAQCAGCAGRGAAAPVPWRAGVTGQRGADS